jgi:hypothetical protein
LPKGAEKQRVASPYLEPLGPHATRSVPLRLLRAIKRVSDPAENAVDPGRGEL